LPWVPLWLSLPSFCPKLQGVGHPNTMRKGSSLGDFEGGCPQTVLGLSCWELSGLGKGSTSIFLPTTGAPVTSSPTLRPSPTCVFQDSESVCQIPALSPTSHGIFC
jgi:hypothetical protein